ncbi:STAS domain-containing protein [Streptomyces sp. NPDC048192]|uniref:STAS domain-containing protein n=1 Tax=Streptomyces sp. NPDC048192 TaxID=3365510 RepID=UPI00371ADE98
MTDAEEAAQSGGLSVVSITTGCIHVVTPAGEIDHHTGDTLRQALDTCDAAQPRIVVDMRQVTFMDSSGINILIAAHRHLTDAGGWLRLAAPTESVLRTMRIVGVDAIIDCRDTLRHALGI